MINKGGWGQNGLLTLAIRRLKEAKIRLQGIQRTLDNVPVETNQKGRKRKERPRKDTRKRAKSSEDLFSISRRLDYE